MEKVQKSSITIGKDIMVASQAPTTALIPVLERVLDRQTQPGVSARALYEFLGLNPAAYARWAKKNIVTNVYAIEHLDWEITQHDVEYRINTSARWNLAKDYVLSIDFAKRLAMMARSAKGEEARQYFLDCERTVVKQGLLPQVKNPANQLMIDAVVRIDGLEQELQQQHAQLMTHQQAMLTMQAQQIEALQRSLDADIKADRAEVKADLALDEAHRMTLEDFLTKNGLLPKFPNSQRARIVHWLIDYCQRYGLTIRKIPVVGKPWPDENGYLLAALAAWLHYEQTKPWQVRLLDDTGRERA